MTTSEKKTFIRPFQGDHLPFKKEWSQDFSKIPEVLDIEVGCGVGYHPIQYALKNPTRFLVAIEHTKEKFDKFYRRFEKHNQPKNILPVHANAISWIYHCLPPESVDRYFFLYPNPYHKKPQHKKRWHQLSFWQFLLETMKPHGQIFFATNLKSYSDDLKLHMESHWKMKLISYEEISIQNKKNYHYLTHFEKKYMEDNQTCYHLTFCKKL